VYRTLLLDLDHTLFDTENSETVAFEQAMLAAGVPEAVTRFQTYQRINLELWSAMERGELRPDMIRNLRFERFVAECGLDADPERMADDFVAGLGAYGDLYAGARAVLEELSTRNSMALVTNGFGEVQRSRIARLGLDEYFDAIAISAEVGASKPHPGIFDFVFESLGSPSRETAVMVGDNLSADIAGGSRYGIATCWYNPEGRTAGPAHTIDHEISDLQELLVLAAH
jgi:YjjG family noncanonical pyrimidine nucleotidase